MNKFKNKLYKFIVSQLKVFYNLENLCYNNLQMLFYLVVKE